MSSMDEFALIRLLTGGRQSAEFQQAGGVVTGIGDDAAVVNASPGSQWILTCDTMTEGIHFSEVTMQDSDIGYKAMASAVSDIAAMGGTPRWALIALTLPPDMPAARVEAIYAGLYACADRHRVVVAGGDTTSSRSGMTLSVTVIGETAQGRSLLRSAARVGDAVFVTGELGAAAAGLELLLAHGIPAGAWPQELHLTQGEQRLAEAHRRPDPQIRAGELLRESGFRHALNDISDGLASEAWEIAEASGVGIDLIEERLPAAEELLHYAALRGRNPAEYILYGGEDYQLLGTVPAEHALELQMRFRNAGLALHVVGYVTAPELGVRLLQSGGHLVPIAKKGYNHFS